MRMRLVRIPPDTNATFLGRRNRFLAEVSIAGSGPLLAHVHDPGRLTEILYPGNDVLLRHVPSPSRKTEWDVIAGKVDGSWILVNASYHRAAAQALLGAGCIPGLVTGPIRAEVPLGESRMDFCIAGEGHATWVEVKGCSLARDGVALFPDAPSKRATRHVRELIRARERGDGAAVLVLIFGHGVRVFSPNGETDPEFYAALHDAIGAGVSVYPLLCPYDGEWVSYRGMVPVLGRDGAAY